MRALVAIFVALLGLSFQAEARTFEEASKGMNCVFGVQLGVIMKDGKEIPVFEGDFCTDGSYNEVGEDYPRRAELVFRVSAIDNGDQIYPGPNNQGFEELEISRAGCRTMGGAMGLNQCALYNRIGRPFEPYLAIQGEVMMGKKGIWISPVIMLEHGRALVPLNGENAKKGILGRRYLKSQVAE